MFKKINFILAATIISISSLIPLTTLAAGSNLITNPSVELSSATTPTGWKNNKWGTNTTTFSHLTNQGHSGTKSLLVNMTKYTSGDAKWYFDDIPVKSNTKYTYTDYFKSTVPTHIDVRYTNKNNIVSYVGLASPLASPTNWTQTTTSFTTPANIKSLTIFHSIKKVGSLQIDDFSLTEDSPTNPPIINLTTPTNNSTVSGVQPISAIATDSQGIKSVQFILDGINLGSTDTTFPYTIDWDTTKTTNGTHVLTAQAINNSNISALSSIVSIQVNNTIVNPPPPSPDPTTNLIPNPSLETTNGTMPQNWETSSWGTNIANFSYLNTGHSGNYSVKTEITNYTDGASNWYYSNIPVTSGKTYTYENWYQSNTTTEVDVAVTMNDGTIKYFWLSTLPANTAWTKYNNTFTVPANAKSIIIYQILANQGYLITDDYSLKETIPQKFNRGLISITFDDGWSNQYTNGLPLLQQNNLPATFYVMSGELNNQPSYMNNTQIKNLHNLGMEIGSHTITHSDMTNLSQSTLNNELSKSQSDLQNIIGSSVRNFAYPYGAYNANTIATAKQYYKSQRSVNSGLNTKDNFDLTALKIHEVNSSTSTAQVQEWVNSAITQNAWLILVFHEITTTPLDPTDAFYTVTPNNLASTLTYIKNSGIAVTTVDQAINEIIPQL